jgi:hypothetical protein
LAPKEIISSPLVGIGHRPALESEGRDFVLISARQAVAIATFMRRFQDSAYGANQQQLAA